MTEPGWVILRVSKRGHLIVDGTSLCKQFHAPATHPRLKLEDVNPCKECLKASARAEKRKQKALAKFQAAMRGQDE